VFRPLASVKRNFDFKKISSVVISVTVFVVGFSQLVRLSAIQEFVRTHVNNVAFQVAFVAAILIFAYLLFQLRQRMRGWYALVEIGFGVLAGVYAANQFYLRKNKTGG
jgi:hypothetical protein